MEAQLGRTNALPRELVVTLVERSAATPEVVWQALADLRSHAIWGGEMQSRKTRLVSVEAPEGSAHVGTEFGSQGTDPMGRFSDRSVVTEATRPSLFEFVTEARLETKKGPVVEWTLVHRYEIAPRDRGSEITYTYRITRISELPGMLRLFASPLSGLLQKMSAHVARRGLRGLARFAEGGSER